MDERTWLCSTHIPAHMPAQKGRKTSKDSSYFYVSIVLITLLKRCSENSEKGDVFALINRFTLQCVKKKDAPPKTRYKVQYVKNGCRLEICVAFKNFLGFFIRSRETVNDLGLKSLKIRYRYFLASTRLWKTSSCCSYDKLSITDSKNK